MERWCSNQAFGHGCGYGYGYGDVSDRVEGHMSHQGLEEVINELKNRGIRAGEQEAEKIIQAAHQKAQAIVTEAGAEARRIGEKAQSDAQTTRAQLDAELRQASAVGLEAFRQAVEKSLLIPEVDERLRSVLDRPDFLQDILIEAARSFASRDGAPEELSVILPESKRDKLEGAFIQNLRKNLSVGIKVQFDEGFDFGFKMAPQSAGYLFDFTNQGYQEILLKFLAPRFRKYFFKDPVE